MRTLLELSWGTLLFLAGPDDFTVADDVFRTSLVYSCQFVGTHTDFLCQTLEGVAATGYKIEVLVVRTQLVNDAVDIESLPTLGGGALRTCLFLLRLVVEGVARGIVVLVELVEFYDFDELVGITWVGGISCLLQSMSPATIVLARELKKTAVALTPGEEQ